MTKDEWKKEYRIQRIQKLNRGVSWDGDLSKLVTETLLGNRFEPQERWCGGVFGIVSHRFPIKGGVSATYWALENMRKHNALLRRLIYKGGEGGEG